MTFLSLYPEIKQHARDVYPEECCGLIVDGAYYRKSNTSDDPKNSFKIDKAEMMSARKTGLDAIVHSHPDGLAAPSAADMSAQIENQVPWLLLTTDGEFASEPFMFGDSAPIPDLMKRTFRHGVTDCYSLVRDYYRLNFNITLKEFPRDWSWWNKGLKMYADGFETTGFFKVGRTDLNVGDMFLANIRSKTPNHAGIYVGDEMVLHHLTGAFAVENRLPKRDLVGRFQHFISYWVRHKDVTHAT